MRTFLTTMALIGGIAFNSDTKAAFIPSQAGPLPGISGSVFDLSDINIDFREPSPSWGDGDNQHSITRTIGGNLDVTVTAMPDADNILLFWDSDDGFGVRGDEEDEIDRFEYLTVDFTENWLLLGVFLSDLFDGEDDGPGDDIPSTAMVELYLANILLETFEFTSDNDLEGDHDLDGDHNNGGFYGATGADGIVVDRIIFRSTDLDEDEYSVAGLRGEVAVIPLPAAMPLFLTALAGLGGLAYRRRRGQAA